VKSIIAFAAAALMTSFAFAQDDPADLEVVLPNDAQKCVLPASPDTIPEPPSYDDLKNAKAQVTEFQGRMVEFRDCLSKADENPDNTPGNKQAIINSYNYSVEMEERVANRFNEAVRAYKESQAAAEG
jgi:hypothetical protein